MEIMIQRVQAKAWETRWAVVIDDERTYDFRHKTDAEEFKALIVEAFGLNEDFDSDELFLDFDNELYASEMEEANGGQTM
jgi:hypothetical protein